MTDITISSDITIFTDSDALTLARYLDFCKQYLYTGTHEQRDKLASDVSSSANSLPLTYGNSALQDGIRLSCELEDIYVWQANSATKSPLVERGQFGTTPADHLAGVTVYYAPKFSDAEILREINNELRSLSTPGAGLFRVGYIDITTISAQLAYDLPITDPKDILDVRVRNPNNVTLDWQPVNNWYLDRVAATSDFPSGQAIRVYDPLPTNTTLRVLYRAGFNTLSLLTDAVLTATGLPASSLDIPVLGAAIRLTSGREIKRNFEERQGDTRRAGEVPAGANLNAAGGLRALHRQRIIQEANNLYRLYPARKQRNWNLI